MEELINLIETFKEFKSIRNINREVLMNILDNVIRMVLHKKYETTDNIDVVVNIDKGSLEIWRNRTVVNKVTNSETEISLTDAKKIESDFELGEEVSDEIKLKDFTRRDILNLKTILISKIHEYGSSDILKKYKELINEIITADVLQVLKHEIILMDGHGVELVLPKDETMSSDFFKKGYPIRAVVMSVEMIHNKPVIKLSRTCTEFVEKLLEEEVPEIYDGLITITDIARLPGERTKVLVETYDDRIDPIGICVGSGGNRIKPIMRELNGENIDIVSYTDNKELLIKRMFNPAKISKVEFNADVIDVYVKSDQIGIAIGKNRSNMTLASELLEMEINIYTE